MPSKRKSTSAGSSTDAEDGLDVGESTHSEGADAGYVPIGGLMSPEGILLVEQIAPTTASSARPGEARQTPLASVVTNALRDLLGQLPPKTADPRATLDLLNRAIVRRGAGDDDEFEVAPYRAVALTETGDASGPQQQLQRWTQEFEQQALPLLEGLRPIGPKIELNEKGRRGELELTTVEPAEADAMIALLRTVLRQLTEELKRPSGPIQERVKSLFGVILVEDFHGVPREDQDDRIFESALGSDVLTEEGGRSGGLIGNLQLSFGLTPKYANTPDEERVLLDLDAFLEHLNRLRNAWRDYSRRKKVYFSTWTMELSRALLVVNEALDTLETELDSAGIGPATRQSIQLTATDGDQIPLQDYLALLRTAVTSDIPEMLERSGRLGLRVIAGTLNWVRSLVGDEWFFDNPVTNRWRVRSAWQELIRALDDALDAIGVGDEQQDQYHQRRPSSTSPASD